MKYFVLLSIVLITGCSSNPYNWNSYSEPAKTVDEAYKNIKTTSDEFKQVSWLESDLYLGEIEEGFNEGVTHFYRAQFNKQNRLQLVQLYLILHSNDWYFIDEVWGVNGKKYNVIQIDRDIISGTGEIREHLAINLTLAELKKLSVGTQKLKVVGKKQTGIFSVSSFLSEAFLRAVTEKVEAGA